MTTRAQAKAAKAELLDVLEDADGVLGLGLGRDGEDWVIEVRVARTRTSDVNLPQRVRDVSVRMRPADQAVPH